MRKFLLLFLIFHLVQVNAQSVGGYRVIDYIQEVITPTFCCKSWINGPPDDSMWVNYQPGTKLEAYFTSLHTNQSGKDLVITGSFNQPYFFIKLILANDSLSQTVTPSMLTYTNWCIYNSSQIKYGYFNPGTNYCGYNGDIHAIRIHAFDFGSDFGLSPTDTVKGIKIDFAGSNDDLEGIYIVQGCENLQLGNDTTLCEGEQLNFNGNTPCAKYLWHDSSTVSNYTINSPGTYWVRTSSWCGQITDTIHVKVAGSPPDLGKDSIICNGAQKVFDFTGSNYNFMWSDNSCLPIYTANTSGWVKLNAWAGKCSYTDSLFIYQPTVNLGRDTLTCSENPLTLIMPRGQWMLQDSVLIQNFSCNKTGLYKVKGEYEGCLMEDSIYVTVKDCYPLIEMPNIFTPNNDGVNDIFKPVRYKAISKPNLVIFNRWGQQVFETTDMEKGWDGGSKIGKCDAGNYFWILNYTGNESQNLKGTVQLLR